MRGSLWRKWRSADHSAAAPTVVVPAATMEQIFDLYDREEIKLVRSSDKTLLFQTRDLREEEVQRIVDDIAEKTTKRLSGFEAFVEMIEAGADPSGALEERFGAKQREKSVCGE